MNFDDEKEKTHSNPNLIKLCKRLVFNAKSTEEILILMADPVFQSVAREYERNCQYYRKQIINRIIYICKTRGFRPY